METPNSDPLPAYSLADPTPQTDLGLPIALRKGKCFYFYPVSPFNSYNQLFSSSHCVSSALDFVSIPKTISEALSHLS